MTIDQLKDEKTRLLEEQNEIMKGLVEKLEYKIGFLSDQIKKESEVSDEKKASDFDTRACEKCGGRTALVTGQFYYEPDSEPYKNGIEEEAMVDSGECWVGGYKCDDCGHVQGMWHE